MPTYEFECSKCDNSFALTMSMAEYDKRRFQCPTCKSRKVKQRITHFQTKTSKKS
jgi:putative FmdB family regulatory protein